MWKQADNTLRVMVKRQPMKGIGTVSTYKTYNAPLLLVHENPRINRVIEFGMNNRISDEKFSHL